MAITAAEFLEALVGAETKRERLSPKFDAEDILKGKTLFDGVSDYSPAIDLSQIDMMGTPGENRGGLNTSLAFDPASDYARALKFIGKG